jgi:chemotaxis protein CheD
MDLQRQNIINVGMAEHQVSNDAGLIITAAGLGSCIGLVLFDPVSKIGGMSHIVLPDSNSGRDKSNPWKYADTAVPLLVAALCTKGALRSRLWAKMAGGAQMFAPVNAMMNIGARNAETVQGILAGLNIRLTGTDVGGKTGRTVRLYLESGKVTVKTVGGQEVTL